jgi:hypothetical protein
LASEPSPDRRRRHTRDIARIRSQIAATGLPMIAY